MANIYFDNYAIKARLLPAVVTILLPLILFNTYFTSPELTKLLGAFKGSEAISNIGISVILMFYLSQFARIIGKSVFEKWYFKDELKMPTTEFMLYSNNQYSPDYKLKFATKVKDDFGIVLSTSQEEDENPDLARKRIIEAMSSVRKSLTKNEFLLQHNIEYGAMRNTIGGSLIGLFLCILNFLVFNYYERIEFAIYASCGLGIFFILMIIFSKPIIIAYGKSYAKILFREYLG